MQLRIRTYQSKDYPFLVEMFYQSLYVPEGKDPYDRGVIQKPELARYFIEWGRPTDFCFIAEHDGKRIGAVWVRFFTEEDPGYGFVEERFPELGIALLPDYRGKGVGSELLEHLIQFLKTENIPGVSLSVDLRNPAYDLYLRKNFIPITTTEESVTMLHSWDMME